MSKTRITKFEKQGKICRDFMQVLGVSWNSRRNESFLSPDYIDSTFRPESNEVWLCIN